MRYRRYGRAGVLVEVDDGDVVLRLCAAIEGANIAATARPGWRSVLVESALPPSQLESALRDLSLQEQPAGEPASVQIEVVYDGEDLEAVARATGLDQDEVVRRHAGAQYVVRCLGFARGFPYLEGLHESLWLPRRSEPRPKVPKGSVAIAADQAGIYPQAAPGGWHLLGRTEFDLFDVEAEPPTRLRPADRVRFVAVA